MKASDCSSKLQRLAEWVLRQVVVVALRVALARHHWAREVVLEGRGSMRFLSSSPGLNRRLLFLLLLTS